MATDDAGERTEQPTARRLQEARQAGRIPRSHDLTAAIALVAGLLLLKLMGGQVFGGMLRMVEAIGEPPDVAATGLLPWITRVVGAGVRIAAPFLLLLVVITGAGMAIQSGMPLAVSRLAPRLDHLNPMNGLRRLLSLDSAVRTGLGVLKMVFVAAVAYACIVGRIDTVLNAATLPPETTFQLSGEVLFQVGLRLGLTLLILALLDYAYQRWNWWRNLKMTKQEVRDELKNMEGDPHVRQRRRQLQLRLAMQRINIDVPKSDVVVSNPTEYAVALKYDERTMEAPRVTAKGKDLLALRIRQVAQQHGIPIVQRPPLARALYAAVEVGQEIPPAFYRAVAEVLAYVYQLTGRVATAGRN